MVNFEAEKQVDETIIYDSDDSEIRNGETIYDFKNFLADDFGQLKFNKSELVQFIGLD